jgi:hypothetical protein
MRKPSQRFEQQSKGVRIKYAALPSRKNMIDLPLLFTDRHGASPLRQPLDRGRERGLHSLPRFAPHNKSLKRKESPFTPK